jgi:hypothetical protein
MDIFDVNMPQSHHNFSKSLTAMKQQPIELLEGLRAIAAQQSTSLSRLSKEMGQNVTYIATHMKKGDPRVMLLVELSKRLQVNLLEAYLDLLPDGVRTTAAEQRLAEENAQLRKELEEVKAERDKYWRAIENRFR